MNKKNKKGQIALIETVFLVLLFITFIGYLKTSQTYTYPKNYHFTLQTALESLTKNEQFRTLAIEENLSTKINYTKWEKINQTLNKIFYQKNYELILLNKNGTKKKKIYYCNHTKFDNIDYEESIIFDQKNSSKTDFKRIRLGICY